MQTFKPQLALSFDKAKNISGTYFVFEKLDGWYGYMDLDNPGIFSRAERRIPSCDHLATKVLASTSLRTGRLIFEILLTDVTEFSILNGILNRSVGDCKAVNAYLKCHDYIDDYETDFQTRYDIMSMCFNFNHTVRLAAPISVTDSHSAWWDAARDVWSNGGEGVILKKITAPYSSSKRNADLIKIKERLTLDLLVTGLAPGEGKYAHTLGALIVTDSSGKAHTVSGMTDGQRSEWWANPSSITGEVVEIVAMKKLPDGSLREPRFKSIRYDKSPSDID